MNNACICHHDIHVQDASTSVGVVHTVLAIYGQ